jgi:hypothetical protein
MYSNRIAHAVDDPTAALRKSDHVLKLRKKIALYFAAGAEEVWICEQDGTLKFHSSARLRFANRLKSARSFPHVSAVE